MKFTRKLVDVLKNFSCINPSILFKQGDTVSTVSPQKTVLATAKVDTVVSQDFAIYDLHEFLGVLSLMPNCDVLFTDHQIVLSNGTNNKVKYTFANPQTIVCSPYKEIEFADADIITEFEFASVDINNLIKMSAIWKTEDILIEGVNGEVTIKAGNLKDNTSSTYTCNISTVVKPFTTNFNYNIKVESLKIINSNYMVTVPTKKLIKLKNADADITYWLATAQ